MVGQIFFEHFYTLAATNLPKEITLRQRNEACIKVGIDGKPAGAIALHHRSDKGALAN
jgi:hypothetical protein